MFERLYVRPKWYRAFASEGVAASLAIHALACAILVASGATPAAVARQVTEGIVFLAPLPLAAAGPTASERLTWVDPRSAIAAMALDNPDLHIGPQRADSATPPSFEPIAPAMEPLANLFERRADSVYFAEQVDNPAAYDERSAAPVYPDSLRRAGITGVVMLQFIVDTAGRVEMETVRLIESTNVRFTEAVLTALPRMLFHPAILEGHKARQLVELPFRFRVVAPSDTLRQRDTTGTPPPR
jgi:TonB family protein